MPADMSDITELERRVSAALSRIDRALDAMPGPAAEDPALHEALEADRPVVVHVHTVKGRGFAPAEEGGLDGMEEWHAAKPGSNTSSPVELR